MSERVACNEACRPRLALLGRSSFRDVMRVSCALDAATSATDYEMTCARLISAQPAALGEEGLSRICRLPVYTRAPSWLR
jgi:hypothetical protein